MNRPRGLGAWTAAQWGGPIKPSIELGKEVKAYVQAIDKKLVSRNRATKDLYGVRFKKVVDQLWANPDVERQFSSREVLHAYLQFLEPKHAQLDQSRFIRYVL